MEKVFKGTTIKDCLESASKELKIDKELLNYRILEEKKGLLRKSAAIMVEIPDTLAVNLEDGTITVLEGKIAVKNPVNNGKAAEIVTSSELILKVNGEVVKGSIKVYEEDAIEYEFIEQLPSRKLDINISLDKMEAYLNIKYVPKAIFKLKDMEENNKCFLQVIVVEEIWPPIYTSSEIRQELISNKIIFGIIEENLLKCEGKQDVNNLLIAKGEPEVESEPDTVEIKFSVDKDFSSLTNNDRSNIDYKSIGAVEAVNEGEVIAIKHKGKEGRDGKDITGAVKRHKPLKNIKLKNGTGCVLKGEDTVVSAIQGKPCIKSNVFCVFPVHEVSGDVDLSTGNIQFVGDVTVHGNVTEGMAIESGNAIEIDGNIIRATIKSKGNINVKGNISNSDIFAGGEDVKRLDIIQCLGNIKEYLETLIKTVEEVKKFNLLGYNTSDGEIIKVLIENKFKKLPRLCLNYITSSTMEHGSEEDAIITFLKNKLLGLAPLNIKHYGELEELSIALNNKIDLLRNTLAIPVNVRIGYCQESNISSSGDIFIAGKGALTCHMNANNAINFISDNSVIRGCVITAGNEIKCKTVGSTAGVSAKLIVKGHGHIYADVAYQNTTLVVGNKEITLDSPSKNIHVYIDERLELVVDKLKL